MIATILGAIGMIDWLVPFLNILCVVVPPITGAMLADFYILKNADNYRFELMDKIPNVRPETSIGAIVGCLVGLCMNEPPVGFGVPFMVRLSTIVPSALVALGIVDGAIMDEMLDRNAAVMDAVRAMFTARGLDLWDIKIEWGMDEQGRPMIIDEISPGCCRAFKAGTRERVAGRELAELFRS